MPIGASAAGAGASLTGASSVRAGDTITLSFNISGNSIFGASGTLSYDSNRVTLIETKQAIASPWQVEFNGSNFVAYDNNLSSPINSSKVIFTATFKIKAVAAGTNVKISCTGVTASDGSADTNVGTVTYSATTLPPLSTNNNLATLTVGGASISPAFSADITSYTVSVPFEVSRLNVNATAADSKAKGSVNSPNLIPDATTKVSVTVTAENGSKKTYTISVKRAKDPNYVASSNNSLKSISVDGFLLSPVFNADTTQYLVWLPYETDSIKVSGKSADGKASVEVVGGENLLAGQDNKVSVICTAENGDKKEYTLIVKRAAAHDGSVDDLPIVSTPETPDDTDSLSQNNGGVAWWWLIVVGTIGLIIGGSAVFVVVKKKN